VALVERALDRSPADTDAHAALAEVLGPGPAGDAALRRALGLAPWSAELRDQLGLRLLARGEEAAGRAELEESMYRLPSLLSHAYLSPDLESDAADPGRLVQALIDGDTVTVRLAYLEPAVAGAVSRGLTRALADVAAGDDRRAIVNDQVTLLEAREQWHDAAAALSAETDASDDAAGLARAARDYLKAKDSAAAEEALLAAVVRAPDSGDLYRNLAVEVYAARGDFPMAARVLEAGQHNAVDLLPVYDGMIEVLQQREAARPDEVAIASTGDTFQEEAIP
jgi:Tfp pilus assembly protein PilF